MQIEPRFLDGAAGPVFAVVYKPPLGRTAQRGIVYLPPFAEELNRARRMAALQARALAAAGNMVLVLDPYGCGDSGGDFGDARWDLWRDDTTRAIAWLRQHGCGEVALLGLRLGALLALVAAQDRALSIGRVMLWQPVLRGEQMMTQFLRLRLAAELSGTGTGNEGPAELRRKLAQGQPVEVAGYALNGELVASIDGLKLADLGLACSAPIDWIEVVTAPDQAPPPAHEPVATRWRGAGIRFSQHRALGEPFWSLQETTIAPELVALTTRLFGDPP